LFFVLNKILHQQSVNDSTYVLPVISSAGGAYQISWSSAVCVCEWSVCLGVNHCETNPNCCPQNL